MLDSPLIPDKKTGIFAGVYLEIKKVLATFFSSPRLTVALLVLTATTVLVGAWCPQESQVGQEKVIEQFGPDTAMFLIKFGIADIFHTPWFLFLIAMLTINIIAGSLKYVFPKLRLWRKPLPWLGSKQITKLPFTTRVLLDQNADPEHCKQVLTHKLKQFHYQISWHNNQLAAEYGKLGRLAPSITHIGLLTLLAGVTITSWTGFSGFKPVAVGDSLQFSDSQHSKLWIGKLPKWSCHVNASRRENYPTGEAKQWYSNLTVLDSSGKKIKTEDISVNNPLSYDGVDIYQSSWGLGQVVLNFNDNKRVLDLQPMGRLYAAFLPLGGNSTLIFSIKDEQSPLRIFAKRPDWPTPKLIGTVRKGNTIKLGSVTLNYNNVIPITGLQYKCDPGLAITFTAFGFIISGVILAAIPHRQLWAELTVEDSSSVVINIGGHTRKAKIALTKQINDLVAILESKQPDTIGAATLALSDPMPLESQSLQINEAARV